MSKLDVAGLLVDNLTMDETVEKALALLAEEGAHCVVTPNAEIARMAMDDADFCSLLNRCELVIPDGAGLVLASRIMKTPLKEKVSGCSLAENLLPKLAERKIPLFLLGGKPGVAEQAAENMKKKHPELVIAGLRDGYFKDPAPVIEEVNQSGAKCLFVCLGAPKQERFMDEHRAEFTTVSLMLGLGGSLDVFAGVAQRAPEIFIKLNLEWFYRLCKNPSRIGRMMSIPVYLFRALRIRIFGQKKGR